MDGMRFYEVQTTDWTDGGVNLRGVYLHGELLRLLKGDGLEQRLAKAIVRQEVMIVSRALKCVLVDRDGFSKEMEIDDFRDTIVIRTTKPVAICPDDPPSPDEEVGVRRVFVFDKKVSGENVFVYKER